MKTRSLSLVVLASVLLSACVVVPGVVVEDRPADFCPPGQAKKGRCAPSEDRGFCPPGQAKKGNC